VEGEGSKENFYTNRHRQEGQDLEVRGGSRSQKGTWPTKAKERPKKKSSEESQKSCIQTKDSLVVLEKYFGKGIGRGGTVLNFGGKGRP